MADRTVDFLGLIVPSDSPLFLSLVAVHVGAGIVCVIAGAMAMFIKKTNRLHPLSGNLYFWGLSVVFVTCVGLSALRWPMDNHLLLLGTLSFGMVFLGRRARRKLWSGWARWHMIGMIGSYIVLLTAFYVDNGPNLPVWKLLPPIWFWVLPSLVGTPFLVVVFLRNPLTRLRNRRPK